MMKRTWAVLITVMVLAACTTRPSLVNPAPTPEPQPTHDLAYIDALPPTEPIIQLGGIESVIMTPFFRAIPTFTLYPDGTLIFRDNDQRFQLLEAHLERPDVEALMQTLFALGIEDLESHSKPDVCTREIPDALCVTDMGIVTLSLATSATERFVFEAYNGYTTNPAAYEAMRNALAEAQDQHNATLYQPLSATVCTYPANGEAPAWPLEAELPLTESSGRIVLDRAQTQLVIDASGRNYGPMDFESGGRTLSMWLIPHMPGQDDASLDLHWEC